MSKFNDKYNDKGKEEAFVKKTNEMDIKSKDQNITKYQFFRILKKNVYFIIPFVLLLLTILGYALNMGVDFSKIRTKKEISELKPEYYVGINDIIVSLIENNNKKSYLKISLSIHLSEDYDVKQVEAKLPIIKDSLQVFLKELRASDFNYPGITLKIKEELTKRINKVVAPVEVKDVLIQDIMVN